MAPLGAQIVTEPLSGDGRGAVRRTLRLGVETQAGGDVAAALILNMSETGLLLQTVVELTVGETLYLEIAGTSAIAVHIVWTEGLLAGCEFFDPVSTGAVAAAQLKAPPAEKIGRVQAVEGDETGFERTLVMISALISAVALALFLAAVWSL